MAAEAGISLRHIPSPVICNYKTREDGVQWTKLASGKAADVPVWSGLEIELKATGRYSEPYQQVEVWAELQGPGFHRRVYGFWDGDSTFRIRMTAPAAGKWQWTTGSNQEDAGLYGRSGNFTAVPATAAQLAAQANLRGIVRATPDGRGLQYADGTPFFLVGDTWWSVPTYKFPLP